MPSIQTPTTTKGQLGANGQAGYSIPDRDYFQELLSTLQLSGHYRGQVEAFYWEQRRAVRRLKATRPRMTRAQALSALREFNDDLPTSGPKKWQPALLEVLLRNTNLVAAAFQDIAQRKTEVGQR